MNKKVLVLSLVASLPAVSHAALQARDVYSDLDHRIEAYYDDVAHVTWWADAGVATDVSFQAAEAFAATSSMGGVTGWRLPTLQPVDPVSYNGTFSYDQSQANGTDGTLDIGYDVRQVQSGPHAGEVASELSYMYYENLQASAGSGLVGDVTVGSATFRNISGGTYWTGVVADDGLKSCDAGGVYQGCRWVFESGFGLQSYYSLNSPDVGPTLASVWLVHDGDVFASPVPEPASWVMLLAGGVALARRRVTRA